MRGPVMRGPMMYDAHPWVAAIVPLIVVLVLIAGAILIIRMVMNRPPGHMAAPPPQAAMHTAAPLAQTPLQILEERFARGEIDEQEFRTRREVLRS
jgi:putative membrane protein